MVSYIKIYTTTNVSKNNKIQYYGVDDKEVATSGISVLGSGDEEIAEIVSIKHKYHNYINYLKARKKVPTNL